MIEESVETMLAFQFAIFDETRTIVNMFVAQRLWTWKPVAGPLI